MTAMKQYLLSIYQPDGDPPPPEVLEPIMRDINAVDAEMRAAGAWVFTGGLPSVIPEARRPIVSEPLAITGIDEEI